jgi:hypothetical protein
MIKKKRDLILFSFITIFLIFFSSSLVSATISEDGYDCLNDKINDKTCQELSLDELIFSVLATGNCKDILVGLSQNKSEGECFGEGDLCSVKQTAQAALALKETGYNIRPYINWLFSQKQHESLLDWFIKIKAEKGTNCTIKDSNGEFNFKTMDYDKIESSENHDCFSIDDSKYWISLKKSCSEEEFSVECDNDFSLSFMFETASTWNILDNTGTFSSGENYTGQIDSYCFKESQRRNNCNYESTLWTSLLLSVEGEVFSDYLPYLTGMKAGERKYLPDSFLYYMTGNWEYYTSILTMQDERRGFWRESGDEYYDTSVALLPFPNNNNLTAKDNATQWLEDVQGDDGCWDRENIKNTAFLLFSIWPQILDTPQNGNKTYCQDQGYYCMPGSTCSSVEGEIINDSLCSGLDVCCTKPRPVPTCEESGGVFCPQDKVCSKSVLRDISDYDSDKICCTGNCINESEKKESEPDEPTTSECEDFGGICREGDCLDNEELDSDYSCLSSSKQCCMPEDESSSLFIWIIIIIIIIGLGVLGYVYRDKISVFVKEKFGKGNKNTIQRRGPPRGARRGISKGRPPASTPSTPSKQRTTQQKQTPKSSSTPSKQKTNQKQSQSQQQKTKKDEEDPFKKLKGESGGDEEDPFKKLKELEEKSNKK